MQSDEVGELSRIPNYVVSIGCSDIKISVQTEIMLPRILAVTKTKQNKAFEITLIRSLIVHDGNC